MLGRWECSEERRQEPGSQVREGFPSLAKESELVPSEMGSVTERDFSSSSSFLFFFFFFLGPHLWQYGSFQARGLIRAVAACLYHSHNNGIQATSSTYTLAHGNTRSLTH